MILLKNNNKIGNKDVFLPAYYQTNDYNRKKLGRHWITFCILYISDLQRQDGA
jgi:hypothetical protein